MRALSVAMTTFYIFTQSKRHSYGLWFATIYKISAITWSDDRRYGVELLFGQCNICLDTTLFNFNISLFWYVRASPCPLFRLRWKSECRGCPTNTIKSNLVPRNFDDNCLECSPGKEVVKQPIPMMAEQTWSRYFVSDKYFAVIWQRQNNAYLVSQILFGWSTCRQSNICWSTQSQSNIWSTCRSNIS